MYKSITVCFEDIILFRMISTDKIDEEDGDFKGKEDCDHRATSEQEKNRVTWNIERRSYMNGGACRRCVYNKPFEEWINIQVEPA